MTTRANRWFDDPGNLRHWRSLWAQQPGGGSTIFTADYTVTYWSTTGTYMVWPVVGRAVPVLFDVPEGCPPDRTWCQMEFA